MRVAFLNPQGNFDSRNSYWGLHPDFGGQLVYVKEISTALSSWGIDIDIITRRIIDPEWPEFSEPIDYYEGVGKLRIVRIEFGGRRFLRKERLWPHLKDYALGIMDFYKKENRFPDFITTHYGDGGIAGAMINLWTKIPYTFTAHSLGAPKMERLLAGEKKDFEKIDRKYNFTVRINAERIAMKYSVRNIVNSNIERYEQYGHRLYKKWIDINDDSRFETVYPGANTKIFNPLPKDIDTEIERKILEKYPKNHLPWVILSSRIDAKKNHISVIKAYAENKRLQDLVNIFIVTRGIDDVFKDTLSKSDEGILSDIISVIRENHIENKVLFFNIEGQQELAALYRIGFKRGSIFALPTIHEPFGLAIIEAMACGLPVIATKYGGPVEILREDKEEYGLLIDPLDAKDIGEGILKLVTSSELYEEFSKKGTRRVREKFTWDNAAKKYLDIIEGNLSKTLVRPEIPSYFLNGKGVLFL